MAEIINTRQVGLLCDSESLFADSVRSFLESLGLAVAEIRSEESGKSGVNRSVAALSQTAASAVLALESSVIQEGFRGGSLDRFATLSGEMRELHAYGLEHFGPDRLIAVKQADDPLRWPSDTYKTLSLSNDKGSAKAFLESLRALGATIEGRWFGSVRAHEFAFLHDWWSQVHTGDGGRSEVPSFTEFLVDSAFNREVTQTKLAGEARNQIRAQEPLDLKYHYVGWKSAQRWLDLTKEPSYGHVPHSTEIARRIPAIVRHIDLSRPCNYISLGTGLGDIDVAVLLELARSKAEIEALFLVDVSIELLQITATVIIDRVLTPRVFGRTPRVRAMLADFEDSVSKLTPILASPGVLNLYTLLGFTIGNSSEQKLLQSLSTGTRPGDFVLFDVRLHRHGVLDKRFVLSEDDRRELVAPYDTQALRAFAFSPVEEASDYAVRLDDESIDFRLTAHWGSGYVTSVPSAINVYVECVGLYEHEAFLAQMGMTRTSRDALRLATLTFYDMESLTRWIEASGEFGVVWTDEVADAGLILIERRPER
jgi:hypothetical protein